MTLARVEDPAGKPTGMPTDGRPIDEEVDVAVIGGGVNGTGVARDLALRGISVALFERHDLGFGASGNSSGMIHGGARYLLTSPGVTKSSCLDSGFIQNIAPHLLFRIPFLMPIMKGPNGRIMLELYDAFFRAYDDFQPLKRGEPHTRLDLSDLLRLEPGLTGPIQAAMTFDEWGVDGARLCVMNALDAKERGAKVHVHAMVQALAKMPPESGEGPGAAQSRYVLTIRDTLSGDTWRVGARAVVNATGAWGPLTAALGGLPTSSIRIRPAKGIHVVFDRRLSNYGLMTNGIDGRQIFLEPWQNMSVIGTTDDDYYGDLNDVRPTSEEVRYLVQGVARIFPAVREARIVATWAAVRPTLYAFGPNEDKLSREHEVVDHAADGAAHVYSMLGGKLASYRLFAEEMTTRLAQDFAPSSICTTHTTPLPGGDRALSDVSLAESAGVTRVASRRLVYRHGSRAEGVARRILRRPRERAVVCACEPVLEAEVRHVIDVEMARTVEDVARRTRLGLGACGGMRCAARCGQILEAELDLAPGEGHRQARAFLIRHARMRIVAMGPAQARQEALALAELRSTIGSREH
jgi:glycerol-3-phosphate dehydrogenase